MYGQLFSVVPILRPMNKTTPTQAEKNRMKKAGTWVSYVAKFDALKHDGKSDEEAFNIAIKAYLPEKETPPTKPKRKPASTAKRKPASRKPKNPELMDALVSMIPPVPESVQGREASETDNIRWIYNHIAPGSDLTDCPSAGAWLELHVCRASSAYMIEFLKGPRSKLIPARATYENENDAGPIDGTPTIDLIGKILAIRDRTKSTFTSKGDVDGA